MKFRLTLCLPKVNRCAAATSFIIFLSVTVLDAASPFWWTERDVTNTSSVDDYAVANIGQLKGIASKGCEELNLRLPGGAGQPIEDLVLSWHSAPPPGVVRDDYAVLNTGQLKATAKLFYTRLIAIGYTSQYPWTGSSIPAADYAAANIGQVKKMFSFDLASVDSLHDADENDLPDWWERFYFGHTGVDANELAERGDGLTNLQAFQQILNPKDAFDGQTPVLALVSGDNQKIAPTVTLSTPVVVQFFGAQSNKPLVHVPIHLSITSGSGTLESTTAYTDSAGRASLFFTAPPMDGISVISAVSSSDNQQVSASFSVQSISPPAPTNLTVEELSSGTGFKLRWQDNAETETSYVIERQNPDGSWGVIDEVSADTTEYDFVTTSGPSS